jgi:hypothetical protein
MRSCSSDFLLARAEGGCRVRTLLYDFEVLNRYELVQRNKERRSNQK